MNFGQARFKFGKVLEPSFCPIAILYTFLGAFSLSLSSERVRT